MNGPLVSVILPVFNGEKVLAESIGCVLKQDYRPIELIIVDDGSTDATAQIAAGFADKASYLYQPNSGPAAARNFGIRKAKGDFITFIDADDLWPDGKLRLQMSCFDAFPRVEIVQGLIKRIKLPDQVGDRIGGVDSDFAFVYSNLGSMVIRRSVFDRIGYFDEGLLFHEDTDFWLRAREAGIRILVQRKVSLIYRIHGRNLTTGEDIKTMGFLNILKRSIERRRKASGQVQAIPGLVFSPGPMNQPQPSDHLAKRGKRSWPAVSVILHVGANPANIGRALDSIRQQDYQPIEMLMVGSQLDRVQRLVSHRFDRIEWIEHESPDLASQLNTAIPKCSGELIAFLDADGEWTPGKMETQVAHLLEHPSEGYVVGRVRHIIQPGMKYPSDLIDSLLFRKSMGDLLDTLMIRRSTFEQVGEFRTALPGMEETDWVLRASDMGIHKTMLPDVFLFRFIRPDFHFVGMKQMRPSLLESVRASVHRKRNAGQKAMP